MNIVEFYTFQTLLRIAMSMMGLYLPIFLLTDVGYPLWGVILIFLIWCASFVILDPFAGFLVGKVGLKRMMALQLPFIALFYFMFQNWLTGDIYQDLYVFVPILFLYTFFRAPGFLAKEVFLTKNILKKNPGKMLALIRIVLILSTVVAPLVGGLVASLVGFDMLFNVAIGLIILSGIPLFFTPDKHFKIKYNAPNMLREIYTKVNKNYLIADMGYQVSDWILWVVWPLFLYFAVQNTEEIGLLATISGFISMLVAYFVGKRVDSSNPKKILKLGIFSSSFLFLLRPLFLAPVLVGVVDTINKIARPLYTIPYDKIVYKLVNDYENQIEMANIKMFLLDFYCMISALIIFIIVLIFSEMNHLLFIIIFSVTALMMLSMLAITRIKLSKEEKKEIDTSVTHLLNEEIEKETSFE